jgi:pimeloyl-ACP methyl ester carboxylesterase
MYLECQGEGSPTVILEAGFRNSSGIWHLSDNPGVLSVWDTVGAMTRVCAYDRPGTTLGSGMTSKSDPVPMPRTGQEIVRDLHVLLASAHVPGPYILVAHSMGGIFSRLYTSTFPDSVIGLVLVDALPENIAQIMGDPDGPLFLQLIVQVPDVFKDYKGLENVDLPVLNELMMRTVKEKPLRPMPLVVLARGKPIALPEGLPAGFSDLLESSWRKGQLYLASLIANSQFVVAQESEHYIQVEQPELVADALRHELDAIRWSR